MSAQPEALRLAEQLESWQGDVSTVAAAELRRLHALNVELLEALKNALELAQREYSTASTVTLGSLQHKKYDGTPTKLFDSKTFNLGQWEKIIAKAEGEVK